MYIYICMYICIYMYVHRCIYIHLFICMYKNIYNLFKLVNLCRTSGRLESSLATISNDSTSGSDFSYGIILFDKLHSEKFFSISEKFLSNCKEYVRIETVFFFFVNVTNELSCCS